jgi:hypothetical protein
VVLVREEAHSKSHECPIEKSRFRIALELRYGLSPKSIETGWLGRQRTNRVEASLLGSLFYVSRF